MVPVIESVFAIEVCQCGVIQEEKIFSGHLFCSGVDIEIFDQHLNL